jgi:carbon-monoxide dehydrogenase medium subunit
MTNVEQALAGQAVSPKTIESASQIAGKDLKEINADIHASESYRRAMIPVFTRRALEGAAARV